MKKMMVMACGLAMCGGVALAADTPTEDFVNFPAASGDLASAANWGDLPLPDASTHVTLTNNATYTLSADLSVGSIRLKRNNIVLDFTDGNHTLTLNTMCSVWGSAYSLFQYANDYSKPAVTLKGGVWKSASDSNKFWFVPLGNNGAGCTHTLTITDGCIITNVGSYQICRRLKDTRNYIKGGSRLYGKTMYLWEVSGTNNLLDVSEGAGITLSEAYYGDGIYDTNTRTWGYAQDVRMDIHGAGSFMKVTGSSGTFVGRYSSGLGLRVRDGGSLETTYLMIGRCVTPSAKTGIAVSSNNWMEVLNGGSIVATLTQFYGPNNRLCVSNASFTVTTTSGSDDLFSMGPGSTNCHHNSVLVTGPETSFNVYPQTGCDVMGRYGHHNTFILANGAKWLPKKNCMFFFGSNNIFRVTGAGTVFDSATTATNAYYQTNIGPAERNGDVWASNTWNNVVEILDGAEFRANRLFVHGWSNKIVVSNATLTVGSYREGGKDVGYGLWLGRQTSSNCTLVVQGTTPKVQPLYPTYPRSLLLTSASVVRYEIPREGYAAGYAPIEHAWINPASTNSRFEIVCEEWAIRGPRNSRELVLFRGDRPLATTNGAGTWLAGQDLHLPPNVTCFFRDKELILKREVPGLHINIR